MSEQPEYLVERLRTAFAEDPRLNELGITATVVGRRVFLRGSVMTEARRASVLVVAREVLPEHEIVNECVVETARPPDPPEVLA